MPAISARKVPPLYLQAQFATIRSEVMPVIERVVDSQMFIMGETSPPGSKNRSRPTRIATMLSGAPPARTHCSLR